LLALIRKGEHTRKSYIRGDELDSWKIYSQLIDMKIHDYINK